LNIKTATPGIFFGWAKRERLVTLATAFPPTSFTVIYAKN
jgi:hypothetical protein